MSQRLHRRRFLHLAASIGALPVLSRVARAQAYPTRPVRIVVGYPPGGTNDILARLLAQWLSERLGQQFIVENRPGAASNIGTEAVVRAAPDGYALLMFDSAAAMNATLYDKLTFNFVRDIAPIASVMATPLVLTVNPAVPAKTVAELIAYAKANPGKLNMASAGSGNPTHVAGELFKIMAGVTMQHVPYRGGAPALTDLMGGQVDLYFAFLTTAIGHVRDGKLRALAVTSAARSQALPEVPVLGDLLPGYEATVWLGLGAPKNTPADIIDKLNNEIAAALADARFKGRLSELGGTLLPGSPADFARLIAAETDKWAKVIRAANIKPD